MLSIVWKPDWCQFKHKPGFVQCKIDVNDKVLRYQSARVPKCQGTVILRFWSARDWTIINPEGIYPP